MKKLTKILTSIALAIPTLFGSVLLSTSIMPSESISAPLETSVVTNLDQNGGAIGIKSMAGQGLFKGRVDEEVLLAINYTKK